MPAIAFVMQAFWGDQIGGAERQVQMLAAGLRDQGWRTVYVCERPSEKPPLEVVEGMQVLALPLRKKRWAAANYNSLKSALRESSADLFYQRIRHPYTGLTARAATQLGKPFVWAAASVADLVRRQDLRAHNRQAHLDAFLHPVIRKLEDQGILQADAVILQTREQQRLLNENYGRDGLVIPNHVTICATEAIARRDPPEVLWVSNVKHFKRPELFLELARRCAGLNARFIMIGSCPEGEIQEGICGAQLPNFTWLGPLEPAEADRRIAAATVLVNTSSFEGFPNAFQQAWIHGVPTLSLEADPDGVITREGLGCRAGTVDHLEEDLRRILGDEGYRKEIAERARSFARRNYDLTNLLPKYLTLFGGLIRR